MPNTVACPHCHSLLELPENVQEREVQCPRCKKTFHSAAGTEIVVGPPRTFGHAPPAAVQSGQPPPASVPPGRHGYNAEEDDEDSPYRLTSGEGYRPAGALALAVKVMLVLNVVMNLATVVSDLVQLELAARLQRGEQVPEEALLSNNARQQVVGFSSTGLYFATAILFLKWFYRAHANLGPLGRPDSTYSSGWAVGYWFIPLLNLVRPVQIAQTIWRNSVPPVEATADIARDTSKSTLIGLWWASWLTLNIVSYIAVRMVVEVRTPQALQAATTVHMVAEGLSVVAALLAYAVVTSIEARQAARAAALWQTGDPREG